MNLHLVETPVLLNFEEELSKSKEELVGLIVEAEELLNDPFVQEDEIGSIIRTIMSPRLTELQEILSSVNKSLDHVQCELIARA